MPSSFFELSVASTGLFTAKAGLNVVAHNISNAETVGYTRQVPLIRARTPLNYQNGRGMIGTGSEVYGIGQIRNFYLDTKFWNNRGVLGEYSAKSVQNRQLQAVLNETDDTGFNKMINDLFGVINRDLAADPGDLTARLATISSAESLSQYFNTTYASLQKQQSEINQEIKGMVSTINNLGQQIVNLNKQIYASEINGQTANDLRDARALVVDELSKYVDIEVKEVELNKNLLTGECEKRYQVSINGYDFINHFDINQLSCAERTVKNNFEDVDGLYDIYWPTGVKFNSEFSMKTMGGELKGLLATRDGNNINNPTANISKVESNFDGNGRTRITLDNWSRADMPLSGNITIDGKVYAYDNYSYDEETGKMTIEIPPSNGKMTVGSSVVRYYDLKVNTATNDITFKIEPMLSETELRKKIKIGDMLLDGNFSINSDGSITIKSSTAAKNINSLQTAAGKSAKIGQTVDYKGLPYFMAKLNTFARGIARSFNLGQDAYGNKLDGITGHYDLYNMLEDDNTGYNFFAFDNCGDTRDRYLDYHLMTAGNFMVSKELSDNPNALSVFLSPDSGISDNRAIVEQFASLKHNSHIYKEGEYGNFVESIIGELGVITNEAVSFEQNYTDITAAVDYQRLSVSSVDLNEEMATMVYLQQIYNACAKLISTLNGIYDTTIKMV